MAIKNGNPYSNFRGINLQSRNSSGITEGGILRFEATTTITPTASDDLLLYVKYVGDKQVIHFWDGVEERRAEPGFVNVQSITATATLTAEDCGIVLAGTTSSMTLTIPVASACPECLLTIKNISANGSIVMVKPSSGGIDGNLAGISVGAQYDRLQLASNGSDSWMIIANS